MNDLSLMHVTYSTENSTDNAGSFILGVWISGIKVAAATRLWGRGRKIGIGIRFLLHGKDNTSFCLTDLPP